MFYWLFIWLLYFRQIDSEVFINDYSMKDGMLWIKCFVEFHPPYQLPNYASLNKIGVEHPIIEAHLVNVTTWEAAHIDDRLWAQDGLEGFMLVTKNYGIGWCGFFSYCSLIEFDRGWLAIDFITAYEIFFIHDGKYECKVVYPHGEYKTDITIDGLLENLNFTFKMSKYVSSVITLVISKGVRAKIANEI